jgi:hypothetical protein
MPPIGDMLLFKINKEGRIVSRGDICGLEYFSPAVEIS